MVKRRGSTKLTNYIGNFLNPSLDTWSEAMHCGDSFPGSSSPSPYKATHGQRVLCMVQDSVWSSAGLALCRLEKDSHWQNCH